MDMQKWLIGVFVLFTTIVSCTTYDFDGNFEELIVSAKTKATYERISVLPDRQLRRLAFQSLTAGAQHDLWNYKFQQEMQKHKNDPGKFAFLQRQFQDFKKISYHESQTAKRRQFIDQNAARILNEAKSYFNPVEIHNLFFELVPLQVSEFPRKLVAAESARTLQPAVCNCIIGGQGDCFYVYQDENGGWHTVYGECFDNVCNPPVGQIGCGMYGSSPCDGWRCRFPS